MPGDPPVPEGDGPPHDRPWGGQYGAVADSIADTARSRFGLTGPLSAEDWCGRLQVRIAACDGSSPARYRSARGTPTIHLPTNLPLWAQSFTVAHELGHHLVERSRLDPGFRGSLGSRTLRRLASLPVASADEERLCDRIAGSLLLDASSSRLFVRGRTPTASEVLALAIDRRMPPRVAVQRLHDVTGYAGVLAVVSIRTGATVGRIAGGPRSLRGPAKLSWPDPAPDAETTMTAYWTSRWAPRRRVWFTTARHTSTTVVVLVSQSGSCQGPHHRSARIGREPAPGS